MKSSILDGPCFYHGVELEICVQLMNLFFGSAFARAIKIGDGKFPHLPLKLPTLWAPGVISRPILAFDGT
jgi:hypothetical protein